jgi:hypothetical protein
LVKAETCIGCGYQGKEVEAGGIYYCPNPICTVSGAWGGRKKIPGTVEHGNSQSVVPEQAAALGKWLVNGLPPSDLRDAIGRMVPYWENDCKRDRMEGIEEPKDVTLKLSGSDHRDLLTALRSLGREPCKPENCGTHCPCPPCAARSALRAVNGECP